MLDKLKNYFSSILDLIAPLRSDFSLVKSLTLEKILSLPKAENVYGSAWIYPLFRYKDRQVKAIIWELKYRNNIAVLENIGKLLHEEIVELISDIVLFNQKARFILIPIPISDERRRERGYNQSEYIARAIMENDLGHNLLYAPQWFEKIRETPRQSHSGSREERMKNLSGCFEANPQVAGNYIFLIDDVVTTGSTLSEARKTLLSAGAMDVYAFTIAH